MQKPIYYLFAIVMIVFTACQSDTDNTQSASTNSTDKAATTTTQPSVTAPNNGKQIVVQSPMEADSETRVIDLNAMPQPQIKSVGNVAQPQATAKPKSQSNINIEAPAAPKPSAIKKALEATQKAKSQTVTPEPKPINIENTQPSVIGASATKATTPSPPPPSKKEQPKVEVTNATDLKIETKPTAQVFSHAPFDQLLKTNISSTGKVNYKAFKANQAALDNYIKGLASNPVQSSWSKNKKMAYWINAYNAFTIKLIVDNYPVSKITDLEGGKPWDKKWIKLGDKTYSLNNIENDILRPQFKDARIHFAVNCAAKSCPPILNRAWTESNLNSNFDRQAKAFINNGAFNNITADKVELSKIFEWYGEDFGDLITYLNKYSNTKINPSAKVTYMDYNWNLNE